MDKIVLEGIVLYGYHGTYLEERKLGQSFVVDVELHGDFEEAARTDDLKRSVDYALVFERVKSIIKGKSFHLLEALALSICNTILSEFAIVQSVVVRVKKPHVPLQGILTAASVEMTRSRG